MESDFVAESSEMSGSGSTEDCGDDEELCLEFDNKITVVETKPVVEVKTLEVEKPSSSFSTNAGIILLILTLLL